jgi:hypothetical protein
MEVAQGAFDDIFLLRRDGRGTVLPWAVSADGAGPIEVRMAREAVLKIDVKFAPDADRNIAVKAWHRDAEPSRRSFAVYRWAKAPGTIETNLMDRCPWREVTSSRSEGE